jgi:hypothetical protein
MMLCCKDKTTPFCDKCGADLKSKTLEGLKEHLEGKLEAAKKRHSGWLVDEKTTVDGKEAAKKGIARSTNSIVQLESWIAKLDAAMVVSTE